jgi:hypothetical protein
VIGPRLRKADEHKPLPPYGAQLLERMRYGGKPNTFIMAGANAWNDHRARIDRVVLPPDKSPDDYDWSIFQGLEPTIIADDGEKRTRYLAWKLLEAGANLVCVIFRGPDNVITCWHFRE